MSKEDGVLQVIISGGVHDRNDIAFPRQVTQAIRDIDEKYLEHFRDNIGLEFED